MKKVPFKQATFITSALKTSELPEVKGHSGKPLDEIALVGRSNVGKSSLLNHLLQKKRLAKVSSTPGKTQRINYFLIDEALLLVDLPGYGFARVSQNVKKDWGKHIEEYLSKRTSLKALIFLLDIRRTPSEEDISLFHWASSRGIPLLIVFTKCDKLKKREIEIQEKRILELLGSNFSIVHYSIKDAHCRVNLIREIGNLL